MGPRWPGHYFCQFEKSLPQPEIKWTRRLVFHSILDLLQKICFWANFNSSYDIILSYFVKNSIQRNKNRREIAFVCQNNKRNESITLANKSYVFGKSMEKVTYVWKIKLSRPWTFDNDSCRLRVISHLYWWSNSEVFVDVWLFLDKSIGEFSMVYKKCVLWCGLGSIITISACN